MTRLDAINQMLAGIGEAPVSTESSQHPDVLVATSILDRINEELQAYGWWFNTDHKLILVLDVSDNSIPVPANTLRVDPTDTRLRFVRRNGKLYDPVNSTFVFKEAVECQVVFKLDFVDMPVSAQHYIAAASTYQLHLSEIGDENKLRRLLALQETAHANVRADELRNGDYNAKNAPTTSRLLNGVIPYTWRT